jgi:uroporphyrinogen-III synthase
MIEQHGGQAVLFPTLIIQALPKTPQIIAYLKNLSRYQWLIFISVNAVNFAQQANNGKIDNFKQVNIAVIGKATDQALRNIGLTADWVPETGFNSVALLARPFLQAIEGQHFLIIRGQGGRETLANTLKQRGATVDYLEVYQRIIPKIYDDTLVVALLKQKKLNAITITSGETLINLMTLLTRRISASLLLAIPLIVISKRIKAIAIKLGFKHVLVSSSPTDRAIINTVTTACNGEDSG